MTPNDERKLVPVIVADVRQPDGTARSVYRTIGPSTNYGGSTLVESIGLGDAESLDSLTVTWPVSHTTQTFHGLKRDTLAEITEGAPEVRVVRQSRLSLPRQD
jgi:hypothetical protein